MTQLKHPAKELRSDLSSPQALTYWQLVFRRKEWHPGQHPAQHIAKDPFPPSTAPPPASHKSGPTAIHRG